MQYTVTAQNLFSSTSTTLQLKANGIQKMCLTDEKYAMILDLGNPGAAKLLEDPDVSQWSHAAYGNGYGDGYFAVLVQKQSGARLSFAVKIISAVTNEEYTEIALDELPTMSFPRFIDMVFGKQYLLILLDDPISQQGFLVVLDYISGTHKPMMEIKQPGGIAYGYGYFAVTIPSENKVMILYDSEAEITNPVYLENVGKAPTQIVHIPLYGLIADGATLFGTINSNATGTNETVDHTLSIILVNNTGAKLNQTIACGAYPTAIAHGQSHIAVAVNQNALALVRYAFTNQQQFKLAEIVKIGIASKQIVFGNTKFAIAQSYSNAITFFDINQYTTSTVLVNSSPLQLTFIYPYFLVRHPNADVLLVDSRTNTVLSIDNLPYTLKIANQSLRSAVASETSTFLIGAGGGACLTVNATTQDMTWTGFLEPTNFVKYGVYDQKTCLAVSGSKQLAIVDAKTYKSYASYQWTEDVKFYGIAAGREKFAFAGDDAFYVCDARSTDKPDPILTGQNGGWTMDFGEAVSEKPYFAMLNHTSQSVSFLNALDQTVTTIPLNKPPYEEYIPYNIVYGNGYFAVLSVHQKNAGQPGILFLINAENLNIEHTIKGDQQVFWENQSFPTLIRLAYGNDYFAMIHTTGLIYTINAKQKWDVQIYDVGGSLYSIGYGNRKFAITNVLGNSVILLDPENHTSSTISNIELPYLVEYGKDKFLIACASKLQQAVLIDSITEQIQSYFLLQFSNPIPWDYTVFVSD